MTRKILLSLLGAIAVTSALADGYYKDGVQYLYYNDNNNVIRCQVMQLCQIRMLENDEYSRLVFTRFAVWQASAEKKNRFVDNNGVTHIILQPVDKDDSDNKVMLIGKNYQYSFNLIATDKQVKTNTYQFTKRKNEIADDDIIVDNGVNYNLAGKTLYRNYTLSGDTDSPYKPVDVFNDGMYTYIKFESSIERSLIPTLYTYDRSKTLNRATGATYQDHMYVISSVEDRYALVLGSPTSQDSYKIYIRRQVPHKTGFWNWLMSDYADE